MRPPRSWARLASKEVAMPSKAVLGKRLRAERIRQSSTLKQVEGKSGVSATHISQIERGITWPTVNALNKISRALERNMSFFLEEIELPEISIVCGDRDPIILCEKPRVVMRPLTNGIPGGKLHFYLLEAESSNGSDGYITDHVHEGDECGCVLSGNLEVKIGDEIFNLKQGDSIHFSATKQHGIRNIGDGTSRSIWTSMSLGF
jgi:transcriptional regulator with XRE-family HTH domain